jgi:hypothetical protein
MREQVFRRDPEAERLRQAMFGVEWTRRHAIFGMAAEEGLLSGRVVRLWRFAGRSLPPPITQPSISEPRRSPRVKV